MRERRGAPEDLPPLDLCVLRELDLREPPQEGRPAHVSSASGLVRRGDFVYVVGDDLLKLAVFRLSRGDPGELVRVLDGELPVEEGARKGAKPDLESLAVLPPSGGRPYGTLLGLGSGSGPDRDRGFAWPLAADGGLHGEPQEVDLGPVYDLLREEVGALNVEGASVVGDRLWLLNRGNDAEGLNAVAELSLAQVTRSLREDLRLDADELVAIARYDLGELAGVPLAFSDATGLGDGSLVFTASAEGAQDGDIRGSVIGTLDSEGQVRRLRTIDRRFKVEGIHATLDTQVLDLLFVCDQDDPAVASPLLAGAMPLDAAHERGG